jgi:hypothetical protein
MEIKTVTSPRKSMLVLNSYDALFSLASIFDSERNKSCPAGDFFQVIK